MFTKTISGLLLIFIASSLSALSPPQFSKNGTRVYFYDRHTHVQNYEFSNFYPRTVKLDGIMYQTAEHAYQAQKFKYQASHPHLQAKITKVYQKIKHAKSPRIAAAIANDNKSLVNPNWHKADSKGYPLKDKVMLAILKNKFGHHQDLKEKLLMTNYARLVEDSKIDSYWGRGADGTGENKLGRLLMKVRADLNPITIHLQNDPLLFHVWLFFNP